MSLRKKLIRLAHANPELRADLLPLIKTAGLERTLETKITDALEKMYDANHKRTSFGKMQDLLTFDPKMDNLARQMGGWPGDEYLPENLPARIEQQREALIKRARTVKSRQDLWRIAATAIRLARVLGLQD